MREQREAIGAFMMQQIAHSSAPAIRPEEASMPPSTSHDLGAAAAASAAPTPHWIRIVGAIAVSWNLIGLGMFVADAGAFGPAAVSPGVAAMPALVLVAFGVACLTGVAGSIGRTLLRRWARVVSWISAVATVIDRRWVVPCGAAGRRSSRSCARRGVDAGSDKDSTSTLTP